MQLAVRYKKSFENPSFGCIWCMDIEDGVRNSFRGKWFKIIKCTNKEEITIERLKRGGTLSWRQSLDFYTELYKNYKKPTETINKYLKLSKKNIKREKAMFLDREPREPITRWSTGEGWKSLYYNIPDKLPVFLPKTLSH